MTKDLTKYNDILQQARTATEEAKVTVAKQFVPQLYEELKNQGFSPLLARTKIVEDCVPMWAEETVVGYLPSEAKEASRAIGGRISAVIKKERRAIEKRYKVLLNHVAIAQIHEAIMASTDGNIWIYLNAKHDYLAAEPVTPRSAAQEPLTVNPVSSAPVKA